MTDKPIKATLDSSDDSVKTQKPILIQLDDIPTPTEDDNGKILGVDEGKYALVQGGGGSGDALLQIVGTVYFEGGTGTAAANTVTRFYTSGGDYSITGAYDYNNEEITDLTDKLQSGLYSILSLTPYIGNSLYLLGCNPGGTDVYVLNSSNTTQPLLNLNWQGILIRQYES